MSQSEFFRKPDPDGHVSNRDALGGRGILSDKDIAELSEGTRRVWRLMKNHGWCTADQIRWAAGNGYRPASEGLRRMRELRAYVTIERKSLGNRLFAYRVKGD